MQTTSSRIRIPVAHTSKAATIASRAELLMASRVEAGQLEAQVAPNVDLQVLG